MSRELTSRQQLQIKCEASVYKHRMLIESHNKSKYSNLILNYNKETLSVIPCQSKQSQQIIFHLKNLKAIHNKYIAEGKVTFQFTNAQTAKQYSQQPKQQILQQILIKNGSKENLQLLISKIIQIKKKYRLTDQKNDKNNNKQNTNHNHPTQQNPINNRKKMRQLAMVQQKNLVKNIKDKIVNQKIINNYQPIKIRYINLFQLPPDILTNIFSYAQINLQLRVISKEFQDYILRNIVNLKLKPDIDEKDFNKIAKWAINVQCRMKNVKNISLSDRYDLPSLEINKAKTLKFGNWKEISIKNIQQLKGLRIYCLQIPYSIKFSFQNLCGIRLVQLRLKGNNINIKNSFVQQLDVLYFLKNSHSLRALELAFAETKLLLEMPIAQQLQQLKINTLNITTSDKTWCNFLNYSNLKKLSIQQCLVDGGRQNLNLNVIVADGLQICQVGSYISTQKLFELPLSIKNLKLIGQKFDNSHILNIVFPNLKTLDISQTKYVSSSGLMNMQNITVITSWEKETLRQWQQVYNQRNLKVITIRY